MEAKTKKASTTQGKKQKYNRGVDEEEELISLKPYVQVHGFNYFKEFYTEETPSAIYEIIEEYKSEVNNSLNLIMNSKHILLEDPTKSLKLKLKFYKLTDDDRLCFRVIKKQGSIADLNELLKELAVYLEDVVSLEDNE